MEHETFSERHGFAPVPAEITIRQDAPPDLRGLLPDLAYQSGLRPLSTLRSIVCRVTMTAPDQSNWSEFPNIDGEVRDLLDRCKWFEVYEVIEEIAALLQDQEERSFDEHPARIFASKINRLFGKKGIGWQLVDGHIEVRGPEAFEAAVHSANAELEEAGLSTAAQEIHEALQDLSRRPRLDITGAIQHAMAAAECVSREFADKPEGTLGKIIKRNPGLFPPPLDKGVDKLWGYASEQGRHLREGREPGYEEAELVVTVAAGVITYLMRKRKAASSCDE